MLFKLCKLKQDIFLATRLAKMEKKYNIQGWQGWGKMKHLRLTLVEGTIKKKQTFPQEQFGNSYQSLKNLPEPMLPLERQPEELLEMRVKINEQECLKQQYG